MPLLTLYTNTPIENPTEVCSTLSASISKWLEKSEKYVMVMLHDQQTICFASSDAPAAFAQLKSLDFPENRTMGLSEKLCNQISELTGIDSSRIYIEFANPPRHMWGWDKRTFG